MLLTCRLLSTERLVAAPFMRIMFKAPLPVSYPYFLPTKLIPPPDISVLSKAPTEVKR